MGADFGAMAGGFLVGVALKKLVNHDTCPHPRILGGAVGGVSNDRLRNCRLRVLGLPQRRARPRSLVMIVNDSSNAVAAARAARARGRHSRHRQTVRSFVTRGAETRGAVLVIL